MNCPTTRPRFARSFRRWLTSAGILLLASAVLATEPPAETSRTALETRILDQLARGRSIGGPLASWRSTRPVSTEESPTKTAPTSLNEALVELRQALPSKAKSRLDTSALTAAWESFQAWDLLQGDRFERTAARLDAAGLSGEPRARLEQVRGDWQEFHDRLKTLLAEPLASLRTAQRTEQPALAPALNAAAKAAAELLDTYPTTLDRPMLRATSLPYRQLRLPARLPVTEPAIVPSYLDLADPGSTPADLEPSGAAPLADEILLQAEELGYDYVAIYEFVRHQIATEWYAGSMKGALGTLRQGAGNDVDQASLLIALYRASGAAARYVGGVIELPLPWLNTQLGLDDGTAVADYLARAGIAHRPVIRGGRIAAFEVEHTWVSAHVPYSNYRGSVVDFSGRSWIPLTPALEPVERQPSTEVLASMGFTANDFVTEMLSAAQLETPLSLLRQRVEQYLLDTDGGTYAEQLGSVTSTGQPLGLLPNGFYHPVLAVTFEDSELPASARHRLRLITRGETTAGSPAILDHQLDLHQALGRRLTLSYAPATSDDHLIINLWGGLAEVPPFLVRLRPQLYLDGRRIAVGEPVDAAKLHRFEVVVEGPFGSQEISQTVLSGAYHAIAVGGQHFQAVELADNDPGDGEQLAARLLSGLAYSYGADWDAAETEIGGLLAVSPARPLPALVIASNSLRAELLLGVPQRLIWEGVTLDAALRVAEPAARDGSTETAADWMRLAALEGSALEQAIFEGQFQVAAISADRGLALARDSGIEVLRLDAGNLTAELPSLNHPQTVRDDVVALIAQGLTVEIPRQPISVSAWTGSTWRAEDPESGTAGYFLSGGLAGGATVEAPENWLLGFLADALAAPMSDSPNTDPLAGVELLVAEGTDSQLGTVDRVYRHPLAVRVLDAAGRPVQGTEVTFYIWAGDGRLLDTQNQESTSLTLRSDARGMARVKLRSGKHTAANPLFLRRFDSDIFQTRVLENVVEAVASSRLGNLVLRQPISSVAFPQDPAALRRTNRDDNQGTDLTVLHGLWQDTLAIAVEDPHGNPVANQDVAFTNTVFVAPGITCTNAPPDPTPGAFFDASIDSITGGFTGCPVTTPRFGDCGSSDLTLRTTSSGQVSAGFIAGPSAITSYPATVSSAALPPLSYEYSISFINNTGLNHDHCGPLAQRFVRTFGFFADAAGQPSSAVRAGQVYDPPVGVEALEWVPECQGIGIADPSPGGPLFFLVCNELRGEWRPAYFYQDNTHPLAVELLPAGTTTPPQIDNLLGRLESRLQAGLDPALHTARVLLPVLPKSPYLDDFNGEVTVLETPEDYLAVGLLDIALGLIANIDQEIGSLWGVQAQITSFEPPVVPLDDDGLAAEPVAVSYQIAPAEYQPTSAFVELLRDGQQVDLLRGQSIAGEGLAELPRGLELGLDGLWQAELVLNLDTPIEVRGDPVPVPLEQQLFADYSRALAVRQDVDLLNQRRCAQPTLFSFELNRPAEVTLIARRIESVETDGSLNTAAAITLIEAEMFADGEHGEPISPTDLPPGDYLIELRGIDAVDGYEEVREVRLSSDWDISEILPIGHTLVHGVDLFDGHLTISRTDLEIPGRGIGLALRRTYSSLAVSSGGPFGLGWNHRYQSRVVITPCGEAILIGGEGSGLRFVDDGQGGLRPLRGSHGTLRADPADGGFDFFTTSGNRFHYLFSEDSTWHLAWTEDPNGNRTTLTYIAGADGPLLRQVTDSSGRALVFDYRQASFAAWDGPVIEHITGPGGLAMSFEYDRFGNLITAQRDNQSRIERYTYQTQPNAGLELRPVMTSTTNGLSGASTQYTWQSGAVAIEAGLSIDALLVSSITHPEGGVATFAFDQQLLGNAATLELETTVTDRRQRATTYRLNRYGSPLVITDPIGHTTRKTWTPGDVLMLSRTDQNGVVTSFEYDQHGNRTTERVQVTDETGTLVTRERLSTYFSPSAFIAEGIKNHLKSHTDGRGHTTQFEYDAQGNLTRQHITVIDAEGAASTVESRHTYYSNGDRRTTTDARSHASTFTWDTFGNPATVRDRENGLTTFAFDSRGRQLSQTDPNSHTTRLAYDDLDRLILRTLADGSVEQIQHDDIARTRTQIDPRGHATRTSFDLEGRPIEIVNAEGGQQQMEYDPEGNLTLESTVFDATTLRHNTLLVYDDAGRLIRREQPEGRTTDRELDPAGNVLRQTLADRGDPSFTPRVTETDYDRLNRPIETRRLLDAGFIAGQIAFDLENNPVHSTDPLGRVTTITFDALDREIERTEPEWKAGTPRVSQRFWDGNGNLIKTVLFNEPENQIRETTYDRLNRPIRQLDATGELRTMEYDPAGNLTVKIDRRGHRTEHQYDERNRRIKTTVKLAAGNAITEFTFDPSSNLIEQLQPNQNRITHTYDPLNRRLTSDDREGQLSQTGYDARGVPIRQEDANGNVTLSQFDGLGRMIRQDLPEDRTVLQTYDVAGNRLATTNPRGHATTARFDTLDRQIEELSPAPFNYLRQMTWDDAGNLLSETDRRGNTTEFTYDDINRRITRLEPPVLSDGSEVRYLTTWAHDAAGNQLTEIDPRGILTENRWDAENRRTHTLRASLLIEQVEFDAAGNRTKIWDANRNLAQFDYDERQLIITERRPLGATTTFTRDSMGDVIRRQDPAGRFTDSTFDFRRRQLTSTRFGAGNRPETTAFTYDSQGNRTSKLRPEGNAWTYSFDGAHRLTEVEDPDGDLTTYELDQNGNLITQIDAASQPTTYTWDELDRRTSITQADGATETLTFDENGNLAQHRDAKNQLFTRTHDSLNREIVLQYPEDPSTDDDLEQITTTWDANGNHLQTAEHFTQTGELTTTQTWDDFDRLATRTDRWDNTLIHGYDLNGNRTLLIDPAGIPTTTTFDTLNRVDTVTTPGGVTDYQYLANSLLSQIDYPNGTTSTWQYDPANRIRDLDHRQNTALISSFQYQYDRNGNRTEQIETHTSQPAETTIYAFDPVDRLATVAYPEKTVTTTYDAVGNRISESAVDNAATTITDRLYAYDNRHRLTSVADQLDATQTVTYTHDANGNQSTRTRDCQLTQLTYDTRDQLTQVIEASVIQGTYAFDATGLRVQKLTAEGEARYVYDQQSVLTREDSDGITKFNYGPDRLLSVDDPVEGRAYYLHDALGSVVGLMTPGGSLLGRYKFDAWGNKRASVETAANPFGFTGHEHDDETGLIYAKARFYDPELGLFLSSDPVEGDLQNPPSLHRYLYAFQNPTVFTDPDGRIAELVSFADNLAEERRKHISGEADQGISGRILGSKLSRAINAAIFGVLGGTVSTANFIANNLAAELLSEDNVLRREANDELGQLALGLEGLVATVREDPLGTVRQIVEFPSNTSRGVLDTLTGDSAEGLVGLAATTFEFPLESIAGGGLNKAVRGTVGAAVERQVIQRRVHQAVAASRDARPTSNFAEHTARVRGVLEGPQGNTAALPDRIFRGAREGNAKDVSLRPGETAVSFRDSSTNPLPLPGSRSQPVLRPGQKFIEVDPLKLPRRSVLVDGGTNGLPSGHVSVIATAEEIIEATVGGGKFPNLSKSEKAALRERGLR